MAHYCVPRGEQSVSHMGDHLRRMLCDKDPSVMGSALCLLHDLARVDASSYKVCTCSLGM